MNAYYQNTHIGSGARYIPETHTGDRLISFLCAIAAILSSRVFAVITRAVVCTGGFIGFFGVIGSMENGSIGMLAGTMLCLIITLVEFISLKGMVKAVKS